jgi:lipoate-protein ligase B
LQKRLAAERAAGQRPDTLLLLEHPHTYTLGRSGHEENLVWPEAERLARGVAVHRVDRGGDITYHGPGQLVGYPIISLQAAVVSAQRPGSAHAVSHLQSPPVVGGLRGPVAKADYVGYVRKLEEVLVRALAAFGIVSGQVAGLTGVWVQPDVASRCPHCPPAARRAPSKIAAIGVKVDVNGITQHGFALNVAPDMEYFEGIIACGLKDAVTVAMADLLEEPPPMAQVMDAVAREFGAVFGLEIRDSRLEM